VVEIRRIDGHERRISLSEKGAAERDTSGQSVEDFIASQGDVTASLGDVFGDLSEKIIGHSEE
jgi:hypothetical protein